MTPHATISGLRPGAVHEACSLLGGYLLAGGHAEVLGATARARAAIALAARVPERTAGLLQRMQVALEDEDVSHLCAEYERLFVREQTCHRRDVPVPPWIECYAPAHAGGVPGGGGTWAATGNPMNHVGLRLLLVSLGSSGGGRTLAEVRSLQGTMPAWTRSLHLFGERLASLARRVFWREVGFVVVDVSSWLEVTG